MSKPQPSVGTRTKAVTALILTFAAGCVDIIGFFALYHIFTAHMTGVTVHLGENLLHARWTDALLATCVLAAFLAGSVFGRSTVEVGKRRRWERVASVNLLLEAILLGAVVTLTDAPGLLRVMMLAGAMGLQTGTLTRLGPLTVHTTFVTGMLNKLAQLLSHGAFLTYDISHGRPENARRQKVFREARFMASIWFLYLFGAYTGAWLESAWGARALLLPIGCTVLAIGVDQVVPLSVEEEREEPEG